MDTRKHAPIVEKASGDKVVIAESIKVAGDLLIGPQNKEHRSWKFKFVIGALVVFGVVALVLCVWFVTNRMLGGEPTPDPRNPPVNIQPGGFILDTPKITEPTVEVKEVGQPPEGTRVPGSAWDGPNPIKNDQEKVDKKNRSGLFRRPVCQHANHLRSSYSSYVRAFAMPRQTWVSRLSKEREVAPSSGTSTNVSAMAGAWDPISDSNVGTRSF